MSQYKDDYKSNQTHHSILLSSISLNKDFVTQSIRPMVYFLQDGLSIQW
jgi:hypothetical protein